MRSRLFVLLFCGALLFAPKISPAQDPVPAPQQQGNFGVRGVVLQRNTHEPLKRVLVSLYFVENPRIHSSCVTENDGRFAFTGLRAGKYSLQAQRRGFSQAFQQNEEYSTAIVVGPNFDSEHITFLFDVPATINGTVVDADEEPVANAQVMLFRKGVFSGRSRVTSQPTGSTEASGTFHLGNLTAGTYLVAVSATPWYARNQPILPGSQNAAQTEFDVAYPVTYYGDSTDPAAASPILLAAGDVADVRITLRAVPALHLRVIGNRGQANQHFGSAFFQVGPEGVLIPANGALSLFVNDREEVRSLAPGRYVIDSQRFENGRGEGQARKTISLTSDSTIDFNDASKTAVSGHLKIETGEAATGTVLWLRDANGTQSPTVAVGADGLFNMADILPGRYEILLGNPSELYVKSVAAKGADYSGGTLEIGEGASVQLSIIAGKGVARVNGIALKDDKPFPSAMILLVPSEPNHNAFIGRDQSDADGTFTINFAPPGHYAILAIDDGRDLAYRDPAVIKPYLVQAQIVDVSLTNNQVVKVNVQPRVR